MWCYVYITGVIKGIELYKPSSVCRINNPQLLIRHKTNVGNHAQLKPTLPTSVTNPSLNVSGLRFQLLKGTVLLKDTVQKDSYFTSPSTSQLPSFESHIILPVCNLKLLVLRSGTTRKTEGDRNRRVEMGKKCRERTGSRRFLEAYRNP